MDLHPIGDRIVVIVDEPETQTAGGLFIPETATEKPQRGTVIAAGPGRYLENGALADMEVAVGDSVYFPLYGGAVIRVDGVDMVIFSSSEVLAIDRDVPVGTLEQAGAVDAFVEEIQNDLAIANDDRQNFSELRGVPDDDLLADGPTIDDLDDNQP